MFEDDPDDRGGATKFGIDQRSHLNTDIKNLTAEQATEIYWSEWVKYGCEHLSPPIDWVFFNACVNCGNGILPEPRNTRHGGPMRRVF